MSQHGHNSLHEMDLKSVIHPNSNVRRQPGVNQTIISHGKGITVTDTDGRQYMEMAAGLWCNSLGFGVERLAKVAYEEMSKLGFYHIYRQSSNIPAIELSDKLLELAPVPMSKVLLQCSGSEANDTAVKLVWYYWNAQGKPQKRKIISRIGSYHGSTCVTASLTGKPDMHQGYGFPLEGFLHTEFPHYYRQHKDGETQEQFADRMVEALEQMILREGPETIGAFWAEPVIGAGGAVLPPETYFEKVQAVLKRHDILFVADEIICGFGRTGMMWGSQTFNLAPDMITAAKALTGGLQPISALFINERIFQAMMAQSDRYGAFVHGYTYAGHPVTASVALETLRIYEEMDIVRHVSSLEPIFLRALKDLADHPLVGDARGVGLIAGIEIVQDKDTRAMFAASKRLSAIIDSVTRENGLIVRVIGNRIALSPPLILTENDIEELHGRLFRSLDEIQRRLERSED